MTLPPDPDPLATATRLATALDAMAGQLKAVNDQQAATRKYGHRNRLMIWITFVSIAADVALTILLVFGYARIHDANAQAAANATAISAQHESALAACRTGNMSRVAQVALWDRVLSSTATNLSLKTPAGRQLLAYIRVTFKPRDCATAYRLPGTK